MKLILVKHSSPEIDPDAPANRWKLSSEGRLLCASLADRLAGHAVDSVISSTEPKAVETGELIAQTLRRPFQRVEGLHEHDRNDVEYFHDSVDFDNAVHSLFDNPNELVFGRETADEARQRFSGALDSFLRAYEGHSLAVVAHGTVISLFAAGKTGTDPYALWKRLNTPSYVVLTLPELQLIEVVDSVGEVPSRVLKNSFHNPFGTLSSKEKG
ncbi:MAG: histidine phosphatase family protein, partial [Chloroflexi bacterium]|nr:histidine phosphatase family protein [Chloroflexota bacterium]